MVLRGYTAITAPNNDGSLRGRGRQPVRDGEVVGGQAAGGRCLGLPQPSGVAKLDPAVPDLDTVCVAVLHSAHVV